MNPRILRIILVALLLPAIFGCLSKSAPPAENNIESAVQATFVALTVDAASSPQPASNTEKPVIPSSPPLEPSPPVTVNPALPPQFGMNFIHVFWEYDGEKPYAQPDWIFADFESLGIDAFRQFIKADLFWDIIEPEDNQWYFDRADAVIMHAEKTPIVTLFALQYASPTPPWSQEFQKTMGPEAVDYVTTVVRRYAPYVTYWEIGNEMHHWRAFDPGNTDALPQRRPLDVTPPDGFSPTEQGVFLAEVAAIIRTNDPDAVILMPGMGGLDDYTLNTWFAGVLAGGGSDWFDIVNYHFYSPWPKLHLLHKDLDAFMTAHGLMNKQVWLTETGATSDSTLNSRTDYPNSPETQAADVFRRAVQAYSLGDRYVGWHTYIGSPPEPTNTWRLYGVRTHQAETQPAYYTVQLFTSELLPFRIVESLDKPNQWVYRVETMVGESKYVAWGAGNLTVPTGITQMTSVVPDEQGTFQWQAVASGATIVLTEIPVLLK